MFAKRITKPALIYGFDCFNHVNHSLKPTGLFGYKGLDKPDGLLKAAEACVKQAIAITSDICNAETDSELKKTVKRIDTISDVLCTVLDCSELIQNVHADKEFAKVAGDVSSLLNSFLNQLNTHQGLYSALKRVVDNRNISKGFSEQELAVAKLLLQDFEKSGVHMPQKERNRFIEINDSIRKLGLEFSAISHPADSQILLKNQNSPLEGVPFQLLEYLEKNKKDGSYLAVPSDFGVTNLILKTAKKEDTRRAIFLGMNSATDAQVAKLEELLKERAALANLLNKESYAHMYLVDKMAGSPETVDSFLNSLAHINMPLAKADFKQLKQIKEKELGTESNVNAWDKLYYSQRLIPLSKNNSTHPLPEYYSVGTIFQGLSDIFEAIYGLKFELEVISPGETWHEDVRKINVVHESEGKIGTIYCDLFEREKDEAPKYVNAAHFTVRCSRRIDNDEEVVQEQNWRMKNPKSEKTIETKLGKRCYQLPIVALVTNFPRANKSSPCFLNVNDIETLFHEMGHAMHSMLAQTDYQHISGTRVAMDFVEVPSILMEYFARMPQVLHDIGRHYQSGEKPPMSLVDLHLSYQNIGNGLETQNQIQIAMLDQIYHSSAVKEPNFNSSKVLYSLSKHMNPIPMLPPSKWQVQFSHLYSYGSIYYTYLWSRRWANRIFTKHFSNKSSNEWREGGELLRHKVLGVGGGKDPFIGLDAVGVVKDREREAWAIRNGTHVPLAAKEKSKYCYIARLQGFVKETKERLGSHSIDMGHEDTSQRSKLLQGTERLENASKRLDGAQRLALETEAIGISTLGDLHRQRNQIERTRDGECVIEEYRDLDAFEEPVLLLVASLRAVKFQTRLIASFFPIPLSLSKKPIAITTPIKYWAEVYIDNEWVAFDSSGKFGTEEFIGNTNCYIVALDSEFGFKDLTKKYTLQWGANMKLPANKYGNFELFHPNMLPIGCMHLQGNTYKKLAKSLGIQFQTVVTGFEFRNRSMVPVLDGVLVLEEDAALLKESIAEFELQERQKQLKAKEIAIWERWKKLIMKTMLQKRLERDYL
ncbi:Mitochondrial intermediate peptidase [Terramyces sp. JEL0728]|nr:Mitochondrial intermediate peptidase [Terramyces sp. JEL0728]